MGKASSALNPTDATTANKLTLFSPKLSTMRNIYRCPACGALTEENFHCGVRAEPLLDGGKRERLSKLMSGALRHFPKALNLDIDDRGFASVGQLTAALRSVRGFEWVKEEHVRAVVLLDPKGRFELVGDAIRARYGHSIKVRVDYVEEYPSAPLYHGTSRSSLPGILEKGLLPMRRLFVHLTTSYEDALARARVHPDPVVVVVDPVCLKKRRVKVFRGSKTVYLARLVPPSCIRVAEECDETRMNRD